MNSSFSKQNPYMQLAWDSTSLGRLKECPYKYYLTTIEGWTTRRAKHDLRYGILYASAMETFHKARAEGANIADALDTALNLVLLSSGDRTEEGKFVPWGDEFSPKTRFNLIRATIWYVEQFGENDSAETVILENGKPGIELSFRMFVGWKTKAGEDIILCGHLDRVAKIQDSIYILDAKTTKNTLDQRYFSRYSPDNQMSMYAVAGKIVFGQNISGVIIDAVQLAVGFVRFSRGFANRTIGLLEEWLDDTKRWISSAEDYAEAKSWPMNDKSCFLCEFKEICSKDPSVRQQYLESKFTRQETWDPLKPR